MIPMSELLKDRRYKEYLDRKPVMPRHLRDPRIMTSPPWVVYVQKETEGKWGKKSFWKYKEALKFFYKAIDMGVHDAALNNKRLGFSPPNRLVRIRGKFVVGSDKKKRQATKLVTWKPRLMEGDQEHHWCRYCRRPTVFKYYAKHRVLGVCDSTVPRCCICGASARIALMTTDRWFRVH